MRLNDAKKDHYRKLAKEQGYRSRASFKLIQLNQKYNLIRSNDYVIDLGAAPGGWLQVASKIVEPNGKVIGVDLPADLEHAIALMKNDPLFNSY